ncbi:hypothetical protein [Reyranella massiliensis]|uniref:hypothetical protein n=1 Tax=Reyranella massiliensis TaxID=445220 RepID=UPI001C06D692|nr:hypothetical protein [Reyranella massiliensis]
MLSPDPCARFSRLEMTDAQVDDARRSPESRQVKYLAIMRLIHGTVNECRAAQMEKKD